jgi:hypothetical protein
MQEKYAAIFRHEELFGRKVATRIIIGRPFSVWLYLIPFIFVVELLKRKRETEIFTENVMFPKKLALDAALEINNGGDRGTRVAQIEYQTRARLTTQKFYSLEVHQKQMTMVNLLIDHYLKLLNAEGGNYESLLTNAYQTRDNYEAFMGQLSAALRAIDQAIYKLAGESDEMREQMLAKQTAEEEIRAREDHRLWWG